MGSRLTGRPVNWNTAFATAGAIGGVPTSPTPPGGASRGIRCTSIAGEAGIRTTG